jgi:aquaporin Z
VGNLPYNPARAIASAVFSSGWAVEQLWVFLVAPLAGAAIAGLVFRIAGVEGSAATVEDGAGVDAAAADHTAAGAGDDSADEADDDGVERAAADGVVPAAAARKERPGSVSEAQEFFEGKRS